jgi:hypothetical protein
MTVLSSNLLSKVLFRIFKKSKIDVTVKRELPQEKNNNKPYLLPLPLEPLIMAAFRLA